MLRFFAFILAVLAVFGIGAAGLLMIPSAPPTPQTNPADSTSTLQLAAAASPRSTSTPSVVATTTSTTAAKAKMPTTDKKTIPAASSSPEKAVRIEAPYDFPKLSIESINQSARDALVNILCLSNGGGRVSPISGSGIMIDPKGVILTNAHVAQYVLLSESPRLDLTCVVRSGSPARNRWVPDILYIPPIWVQDHARDINTTNATGTGEHDYALLRIASQSDGTPADGNFPAISFDVRDAIGFLGDEVLVASYPAEFLGATVTQLTLYPASSLAMIKNLFTFTNKSIDVLSLGGVIEAQSGSSGGAVVNDWGKLIAMISTTSSGTTTADRDLHAITMSYINSDIAEQSGLDLTSMISGNLIAESADFKSKIAPSLIDLYIDELKNRQ